MNKPLIATVAAIVFATPAYAAKCNDPAVIATFEDAYIANLLSYKDVGVKNFAELQALDDDQIKQRYEALPATVAVTKQAAANQTATNLLRAKIDLEEQALIAAKHLFTSVEAVPTDYNPNIKKYTCDVTMTFDNDNLTAFVHYGVYQNFMVNQEGKTVSIAAMNSNDPSGYNLFLNMRVTALVPMFVSRVQPTVTFSVQAADIEKTDDPQFILRTYDLGNTWIK
jgi:hypothetical protein